MALPAEIRVCSWTKGDYTLSTDRKLLDLARAHRFLSLHSYWAADITQAEVARGIENSISLGVYRDGEMVGFARVVTDMTRIAYLMDVFIDSDHRGHGLGTWLSQVIREHPDLKSVRRWLLATKDAHGVYARAGWKPVAEPAWLMEVKQPEGALPLDA